MLKVELIEDGIYNILRDVMNDLESVLGRKVSKNRKDEMIYKALGAIEVLYQTTTIEEVETNTESELNT